MKTFTKILLAAGLVTLGSRAASAQVLYDNFENTRIVTYSYVSGALAPIANPGGGTVNTSTTCGKYDRDATQYAVVVISPTAAPNRMADVSAYAAGTKKISMKFRSPAPGTPIQIVLQNKAKAATGYPNGNYGGTFDIKTTAAAGVWETLTFAYTAGAAGGFDPTTAATDVDQMVVLVAPNTTTPNTYYLDDIMGPEIAAPTTTATAVVLDNFENIRLLNYPTVQGTLNQAAANPGSSAGNTSSTVASFVRDGSQFSTIVATPKAGKFADVSGYASGTLKISMKFRGTGPGTKVQVVLQNKAKTALNYPNGNYGGTFDATTTAAANTWETLTFTYTAGSGGGFDPSVLSTDVDQLALLIGFNSTVTSTFYFDDLTGPAQATATATRTSQTSLAALAPAYPNPAAGLTHLPYSLKQNATVSLGVYDAMGRRVATVLDAQAKPAGDYIADLPTSSLAPGFYTCRLVVDGVALTRSLSVQ